MARPERLIQARRHIKAQRYREAHALCIEEIHQNQRSGEALFLLGIIAADHENHAKALQLFNEAAGRNFAPPSLYAAAARSALALNQREDAVMHARKAAEGMPGSADTLDMIGVVLSRTGHHAEAIPFYRKATALEPGNSGFQYNLGAALQFAGDFDGARAAFDQCLELSPRDNRARIARVSITKQTSEMNDCESLEDAWTHRRANDPDSDLQLGHALAKAYDDLGHPDRAMSWLKLAKQQKQKHIEDRRIADAEIFQAATENAHTLPIMDHAEADGPVFITGMPRTGTTLVDRILTSHPLIEAAGELSDFSVLLKRAVKTSGAFVLDGPTLKSAQQIDLREVGHRYLSRVEKSFGITGRFTDKMPLNIFFAPIILSAVPNARIICLRRHPADTVLSNYRQLFATAFSYYAYAYDLEETAHYTVAFNRMLENFSRALPRSRFTIVDYESILDDQIGQTQRMLDFCGLEFDQACLSFHEHQAPVATASSVQVRQPLYTSSRNRWKRYCPAMDPAISILSAAGLMKSEDLAEGS